MAGLFQKRVKDTYPDLLTVLGTTSGEGITSTRKRLYDGSGTGTPLYLGTTSIEVNSTLLVSGTLQLQEKSSAPGSPTEGDLAYINGDLYIAK